jgi:hypothetical protein
MDPAASAKIKLDRTLHRKRELQESGWIEPQVHLALKT